METKRVKMIMAMVLIGGLLIGFMAGTQVQANPFAPGSVDDPLVAQSYVEEQLQLKSREMELEISRMTEQINALQTELSKLLQ